MAQQRQQLSDDSYTAAAGAAATRQSHRDQGGGGEGVGSGINNEGNVDCVGSGGGDEDKDSG